MTDFSTTTPVPAGPTKPVTQSLTFGGLAVVAAPLVASVLGLDPDQVAHGIDGAVQLMGLGMAVYGRYRIGDLHWPWAKG
jgi:hypothetical protein